MNHDQYNQVGENIHHFGFPGGQQPNYFDPPGFGPPPGRPPTGPPSFSPPIPAWQVGSGGISSCLYTNTYIWRMNGSFWFFPTSVGRQFIAGFRWRRVGWSYQILNRNEIVTYQCF